MCLLCENRSRSTMTQQVLIILCRRTLFRVCIITLVLSCVIAIVALFYFILIIMWYFLILLVTTSCYGYRPRLVDDETYGNLFDEIDSNVPLKLTTSKLRTNMERRLYDLRKKHDFFIQDVVNVMTGERERRLCLQSNNDIVIFPKSTETDTIIG